MKKHLVMALVAAVSVAGLASIPAPSAEAAPRSKCIYMVSDVKRQSYYPYLTTFGLIVWDKRGKRISGFYGDYPGHYNDIRGKYKPKKKRARILYYDYFEERWVPLIFKTVGKGKTLHVRGWTRIKPKRMERLWGGPMDRPDNGTRCY